MECWPFLSMIFYGILSFFTDLFMFFCDFWAQGDTSVACGGTLGTRRGPRSHFLLFLEDFGMLSSQFWDSFRIGFCVFFVSLLGWLQELILMTFGSILGVVLESFSVLFGDHWI